MRTKTFLLLWVGFFIANSLFAQCRLVRIEMSDTSSTDYLSYDKLGRLAAYKSEFFAAGKINAYHHHFFYNEKDQLVSNQIWYNDTIVAIRNYRYDGDVMKGVYIITPKDSVLETGQLFYNERGQVNRFFSKKTNGDTFSVRYQYAPEGWLQKVTQQSNLPESCFIIENQWDANERIKDEPSFIFFAGYAISPMSRAVMPVEPLSVKGNLKSRAQYRINKENKVEKMDENEVFDLKANQEGLWIENKWRDVLQNTVVTCRAIYEGCKN
jgi:hypothetical protein